MKKSTVLCGILATLLLTGCVPENKDDFREINPPETTAAQTEQAVSELAETTSEEIITTVPEITEASETETEIEYGEYVYSPPQEVLDTHFYCDDIEAKIEWEHFDDPPEFIFEDMAEYSLKNSYYAKDFMEEYGEPDFGMRYMLYDMNDDGIDDYIVRGGRNYIWIPDYESFYKVYLSQEDGGYVPVAWDCLEKFNNIQYILKTKTNGLRDMMVLQNANYPIITYDGGDSYTKFYDSDERHTFLTAEILPNNILHLNMNISVIGAEVGEYYTAIKFADNPYLKNNMLYTCYPDGTPRSYIEKPFGESLPTDFHASQ